MDSSVEILISQLKTLLIFLERPSVQRQFVALLVAVAVAGLLSAGSDRLLARWLRRPGPEVEPDPSRRRRLWRAMDRHFLWPVHAAWLILVARLVFTLQGIAAGMLEGALTVVLVWAGYRGVMWLLYLGFGHRVVRPYHRRVLRPAFFIGLGLSLLGRVIPLPVLASIRLFGLFSADVTLGSLLGALAVLYVFITLAWIMQGNLGRALDRRVGLEAGVRHSIVTISRYAIVGTGLLLALSALGLDLSTLTIIGGGLSIGVGFGLQQIVANFISGLVLLFEQTLRPGDVIDLDGEIGIVEQLNIRSTVVRTRDDVEVIVPNEFFLTSRLRTYTKSSRQVRVLVPVGVAYRSDPQQIRAVMIDVAQRHGLVLAEPAPAVLFRGFGEFTLNFELAVWIEQPDRIPRLKSDLYFMLWDAFKEQEIEIPYPQRDLHLKSGWREEGEG